MPNNTEVKERTTARVKAFLCHSSVDKPFIRIVANQLGRRRVNFDEYVFESGVKFTHSITRALAGSDSFVMFASRASLQSLWVRFEVGEAEELSASAVIRSAVVLIIDPDIKPRDLPPWMQRSLIERVLSPRAAARIIEYQLNKLRGLVEEQLFIGRESLLSELSAKLIPIPESNPPHVLVVGGLTGIGRRTFLRRGVSDFLSLRPGPVFTLQATDGIDVLHLQLLDELSALDERSEVELAIQQFRDSTAEEKSKIIAQLLASASLGNVAPFVVDEGALLDANARYTAEAIGIMDALKNYPGTTVGLIAGRRPDIDEGQLRSLEAIFIRVPPLDISAMKLLLTQSLRRVGIEATSEQITELTQYLDGYPPAATLAISAAREYGLDTLVADKSGLVDFKIRTFAGVLNKLGLDEQDWGILRILSSEPSLPLSALAAASGMGEEAAANHLRKLIDLNVVLVSGSNFEIASPIKAAVYSLKGGLSDTEFANIASRLRSTYWSDPMLVPPAEIIAATIHAVSRSNIAELAAFRGVVLPSVLYKAAKEQYDKGGQEYWESAKQLLDQLLGLDPKHKQGLVLRFKVEIRLREWKAAGKILAIIRQRRLPEHYYLTGFLPWKQREYAAAISAFRLAISSGHQSPEVYHGLATCLFRLNNLPEADKALVSGLRGRRPNRMLLDLAAQIAIARENYSAAEDYIDQLARLREDAEYHHRYATYLNARKRFADALEHARLALAVDKRRRFEVNAILIDTLIELGSYEEATRLLDDLDHQEKRAPDKRDVRYGLRCKLQLRQGNWRDAEGLWMEIEEKLTPVHIGLRTEILSQKIADLRVSPGERAAAVAELRKIDQKRSLGFAQMNLLDDDAPEVPGELE